MQEYESSAQVDGDCLILPGVGNIARKIYKLRHGNIPEDMEVCHVCDRPRCIKDEHHFLGTHQDNMTDAKNKGRKKVSTESKKKMSLAKKGKLCADSTKMKLSIALTGRTKSLETRKKMSATMKGRNNFQGHKHSEETKEKMRATWALKKVLHD